MKDGEVPQHLQRWAGGDWLGSRVRGYAIRNGDPWVAWIYLDILFRSFQDGGDLPADVPHLADLLGFPEEQIARVLDLLKTRFGKIVEEDGRIFNPRVRKEMEKVHRLSEQFAKAGAEGGKRSGEVRRERSTKGSEGEGSSETKGREGYPSDDTKGGSKKTKGREAKSLPLSLSLSSSLSESESKGKEGGAGSNGSGHPPSSRRNVPDDDVDQVVDAYRRLMKLNASEHPLTGRTAKVIRTALTRVSVDIAIRAIEGCVASDFHMGREGKGVHNGIDRILKDEDAIQTFLRIRNREWKSGVVKSWLHRKAAFAGPGSPEAATAEQSDAFSLLGLDDPHEPFYPPLPVR